MGIIGFFEKRRAKSHIKQHISSIYKLSEQDANVIMNSRQMQNQLYVFGHDTGGPFVPLLSQIQIAMIDVAERFMDELLNRTNVNLITNEDKAKIKYCMGVMVNLVGDKWFSDDHKLLRLDLWRSYWSFMDEVGSLFTSGKENFIPVICFLMLKKSSEGTLEIESDFPIEAIKTQVLSSYGIK